MKTKTLDNYGQPRSEYIAKLAAMNDPDLSAECGQMIWLSAYAANNPRSDYHWQCDATYDECRRRKKPKIYTQAHERIARELS